MALDEKIWTPVTVHQFVLTFLQNEWHKIEKSSTARAATSYNFTDDQALIDRPDLADPLQNHRRLRLLHCLRAPLLAEIPPDTAWHRVAFLDNKDLDQLHVIARCGWDDANQQDCNTLRQTAERLPQELATRPQDWPPIILWGHEKGGPLTIIEGNHRLCGYLGCEAVAGPLHVPAIVGLSPTPFYFHIFDAPYFLANDLWRDC